MAVAAMAALSENGIGGGPGVATKGGSSGMGGSVCGGGNGKGGGGGRGGGGAEPLRPAGGGLRLAAVRESQQRQAQSECQVVVLQGQSRCRWGGDRGLLSRGLFSNNLLGLYDNAVSFQVEDNDNKGGYNKGCDGNDKNGNNDGGCIDICRMAGNNKEDSGWHNQQPSLRKEEEDLTSCCKYVLV